MTSPDDTTDGLDRRKAALVRFGPPVALLLVLFYLAWADGRLSWTYLSNLSPWAGWLTAVITAITFGALSDLGARARAAWDTPASAKPMATRNHKLRPLDLRLLYSLSGLMV